MTLPGDLARQIEALARSRKSTLFMTCYAALALFLHRCSGQTDVVISSPVANRLRPEVERLIGCFANMLILRSHLSDNPRFTDFLGTTSDNLLQAFAHQSVPAGILHQALNPEPDPSGAPMCQVALVVDTLTPARLVLPDLQVASVEGGEHPISKSDMLVTVSPSPDTLSICWTYATDLFDRSTVEMLAAGFASLLEAIVRAPDQHVRDLPFITEPAAQASA